jgi:hypothetical protein
MDCDCGPANRSPPGNRLSPSSRLVPGSSQPSDLQPLPADLWATVASGAGLTVATERVLYERPGFPHFFVHVRVTNQTNRDVAIDLRERFKVFYPNQWAGSRVDHREVVDETRNAPDPFDAAAKASTVTAFRAGQLTSVRAGTSFNYFIDFNASTRADVERSASRYLIVVMDGQLRWSDGGMAGRVEPDEWTTRDTRLTRDPREVAITTPVTWRQIPGGAHVIFDPFDAR